MRIVDAGGAVPEPRVVKDFNASDVSDKPFGWNLPNWLLRREMVARLGDMPGVDFRPGTGTASVTAREREAVVGLSDGTLVRARLLVAADGRDSAVRRALGIGARTTRYGQKAVVFAVTHPIPHDNVSTEIHREGGPFTLVPLPDRDGRPCSAVVWMERGGEAVRLAALPDTAFEAEATARSCHLFGPLRLATRRSLWPIITQVADRITAPRTALMAEAAHVVPPIGAQGLNMSLADLRVLVGLAGARPDGLGDAAMLDAYARARRGDVAMRVAGIDMLNRASMLGAQRLRDLRAGALDMLYSAAPLRRALMRTGLGLT
jgi:2-octaprenyl-6-methoxyphenol hydroxylase